MTDVNSTTEDEFYDDATDEFPSVSDLCPGANNTIKAQVDGRLVAIWAKSNGVQTKDDGTTYPYTDALVLVLDDGPNGDQATDLIPAAPWEGQLRFSTGGTQSRVGPRVDGMTTPKRDEDGTILVPSVPMRFRPMIGRVNAKPSTKVKNGSPAIGIAKKTGADLAIVQRFKNEIIEINQRLEAKAAEVENEKAFA